MKPTDRTSLDQLSIAHIASILSSSTRSEETDPQRGGFDFPVGFAFFGFIAAFLLVQFLLPDNLIGNILVFIAFPVLFLASLALTAFIYREKLAEIFAKTQDRFLIRTRAMSTIAGKFGLDYIPLPGGAAPALKMLIAWRFCPQIIKDIADVMESHRGFDDISGIVRASGLASSNESVIGSKDAKEKYYAQQTTVGQLEDGFKGVSQGMPFAALRWTEDGDETSIHHFIVVLKMPTVLTGRIVFKTRKATWPAKAPSLDFKNVKLVSKDFRRNFEVKATDQMEARLVFDPAVIARLTDYGDSKMTAQASDEKIKIRGSVWDDNLVVDFIGDKRFDLIDLTNGEWDVARIHRTVEDIKDMLTLAEGVAKVFGGPLKSTFGRAPQDNAA